MSGAVEKNTRASKKRKMSKDDEPDHESDYLPTASSSQRSNPPTQSDDPKDVTTLDVYDERPEHELRVEDIEGIFPPRGVALSDYNVGRICATKLRIADRCSRYPFDFDSRGMPLKSRIGRGSGMYYRDDEGELCFAVVCGTTQLHGELQYKGLEAQVEGRRALREEVRAGDRVNIEGPKTVREPAVKKEEPETPVKGGKSLRSLGDLPVLEAEFDEPETAEVTIAPAIVRTISELEGSAVQSMKRTQELIDSWGKGRTRPTNLQLKAFWDRFGEIRTELQCIREGMDEEIVEAVGKMREGDEEGEDERGLHGVASAGGGDGCGGRSRGLASN